MFKPQEQSIYKYHDGEKEVAADPIKLHIKLLENKDFEILMKQAATDGGPKHELARLKAFDQLADIVRAAFGVPSFSMDNALRLVIDFLQYLEEVKKKLNPLPNSPPSTDSLQAK